jgi:hypothetical protein
MFLTDCAIRADEAQKRSTEFALVLVEQVQDERFRRW